MSLNDVAQISRINSDSTSLVHEAANTSSNTPLLNAGGTDNGAIQPSLRISSHHLIDQQSMKARDQCVSTANITLPATKNDNFESQDKLSGTNTAQPCGPAKAPDDALITTVEHSLKNNELSSEPTIGAVQIPISTVEIAKAHIGDGDTKPEPNLQKVVHEAHAGQEPSNSLSNSRNGENFKSKVKGQKGKAAKSQGKGIELSKAQRVVSYNDHIYEVPVIRSRRKNILRPPEQAIFDARFMGRFLKENSHQLDEIVPATLVAAFQTYTTRCYGHLQPDLVKELLDSASTKKAASECSKQIRNVKRRMRKKAIREEAFAQKQEKANKKGKLTEKVKVTEVDNSAPVEKIQAKPKVRKRLLEPSKATLPTTNPASSLVAAELLPEILKPSTSLIPLEDSQLVNTPSFLPQNAGTTTSGFGNDENKDNEQPANTNHAALYKSTTVPSIILATSSGLRCQICSMYGHSSSDCPRRICETCGAVSEHFPSACPQNVLCTKCRQHGHSKDECPEKLAASVAEGLRCDICDSDRHLEHRCDRVWRTFVPGRASSMLTLPMPISCFSCGAEGHYGEDCDLRKDSSIADSVILSSQPTFRQTRSFSRGLQMERRVQSSSTHPTQDITVRGNNYSQPINLDSDEDMADVQEPNRIFQSGHNSTFPAGEILNGHQPQRKNRRGRRSRTEALLNGNPNTLKSGSSSVSKRGKISIPLASRIGKQGTSRKKRGG